MAEILQKFLSPAKVNLFLKVLSKRPDGYHEIFSLMQPVSLFDEVFIDIRNGEGIEVACSGEFSVPGGRDNLAYRAAELFLEYTGIKKAIAIKIVKNIPSGAGLGGGSSNAATTLLALDSLLKTGLKEEELLELSAKIGSDVPFFILKGPAFASGRGERLKKAALRRLSYIIIKPDFPVSTAWAYSNLDLTKKPEDNNLTYSDEALSDMGRLKKFLVNDLEAVTVKRHPEISAIKKKLIDAGAVGSLMSGSGSAVFGIFSGPDEAERAFQVLKSNLDKNSSIFMAEGL